MVRYVEEYVGEECQHSTKEIVCTEGEPEGDLPGVCEVCKQDEEPKAGSV